MPKTVFVKSTSLRSMTTKRKVLMYNTIETQILVREQVKNENYDVMNKIVTSYNAVIDHVTTIYYNTEECFLEWSPWTRAEMLPSLMAVQGAPSSCSRRISFRATRLSVSRLLPLNTVAYVP